MQFSCADDGYRDRTAKQFNLFTEFADSLQKKPRLLHVSNSAATLLYPEYALDAVRVGIGLYGTAPSEYVGGKLPFLTRKGISPEKRACICEEA